LNGLDDEYKELVCAVQARDTAISFDELHEKLLLSSNKPLLWYQSLDDQTVTSSNLTIPIYLIKIKHKVKWACASFKPKELSLEGVC